MRNYLLPAIVIIAASTSLTACGAADDCADTPIRAQVVNLVMGDLHQQAWWPNIAHAFGGGSVDNIRTTAKDDSLHTRQCVGTYNFTYHGQARQVPVNYDLSRTEDTGATYVNVQVMDIKRAYYYSFMPR